jgi:uncharacterized protein (TIGR03437 family)
LFAKLALVFGAIPFGLSAYEYGPPPGVTGAPFDNPTACVSAGCHVGTVNSGPGGVKILLPNGTVPTTYTPGQSMQLLVQISDSTKKAYGFEMTARMGSGNLTQAGDFMPADNNTFVECGDTTILQNPGYPNDEQGPGVGGTCNSKISDNFEYIEHEFTGYTASINNSGSFTYTIDWTPPASGTVTLYVAANCGIGNPPEVTPTDVYKASLTLTPAAAPPPGPTIDVGGVVPLYSSVNTIQPGSWVSIYSFKAQNLASGTATWTGVYTTTLGGVSVTINNKPAWLSYVSPTQINVEAPDDTATGTVAVAVTNASGTGTSTVTLAPQGPSFLQLGDGKHALGLVYPSSGVPVLLGPAGNSGETPVQPGQTLVLYGVGFGPTNPAVPAGQPFSSSANLITAPQITIGGVPVQFSFDGVAGFPGLYQFNFVVPANVGSGDQALVAMLNGVTTPGNVFVPVQ